MALDISSCDMREQQWWTLDITQAYLYYNAASGDDIKLLLHFKIVIVNMTITQFSQCTV